MTGADWVLIGLVALAVGLALRTLVRAGRKGGCCGCCKNCGGCTCRSAQQSGTGQESRGMRE